MTFDIAAFRKSFPEFASLEVYPTTQIQLWVNLASAQLDTTTWGSQWTLGVSLYVAHELVLAMQNVKAAATGGSPGQQGGIATSKSVGSVSVSFDASSTAEKDAGYWNLTNYGRQFIRLSRIFGAGCVQL